MSCRNCRPNRLCTPCGLNAQAARERRELEERLSRQASKPTPVKERPVEEPVVSSRGKDDGYDYARGAYRPGYEPKVFRRDVND